MSALLLDTNIVIHLINGTMDNLPKRIRDAVAFEGAAFSASTVSIWEIAIKVATGRLALAMPAQRVPDELAALNIAILPMSIAHALEVAYPEPATKDPFDRLLLAVCACEGLKLLTTDGALEGHRLVY